MQDSKTDGHTSALVTDELEQRVSDLQAANTALLGELRDAQHRYRSLLDNLNIGLFRHTPGPKGRFVFANLALARLLGYASPDELLSTSLHAAHGNPDGYEELFSEIGSTGSVREKRLSLRAKDGRQVQVLCTATAHRDDAGDLLWIDGLVEDVTERSNARRRLEQEHVFLNSIIEAIKFPLYIIDTTNFKVVLANSATVDRLSEDTTCYELTHGRTSPCDDSEGSCPLHEVLRTRKPVITEHIHYDERGNRRHYEIHAFPIFDSQSNVSQMVEYNIDITERKQVLDDLHDHQQSLELLVRELERSNRELRDFASIAAHDIRSPMSNISLSASLLKESLEDRLSDEQKRVLDVLIRGVERSTELITALNRYSQINAGQVIFAEVDLNRVVQEVTSVQLAWDLHRSGGTVHVPQPLHTILGEEVQLLQLMQNLVGNALNYHRPGVAPVITIRSRAIAEDRICIEVEDNGTGIRGEDLNRVFGMFQRLDNSANPGGSGIGLALCKKIAERHGGRIGATSVCGQGSTFWVELPSPRLLAAKPVGTGATRTDPPPERADSTAG